MPIKFSNFEQYFSDYHPHMMFYGYNGTGKTTLAGKTGMKTVLLDCGDAGVSTLRRGMKPEMLKKLKIIRIRSILHYLDVMPEIVRRADDIELVVVDTISGLRSIAIREVKGRKQFDMNIKKWGQVTSRVVECIHETRNFPNDVIYLAQEKRSGKLGDEDSKFTGPSISDGMREFLSGCIDWVGHLYLEDGERKLSFILTDEAEAKDRGGIFPKVLNLGNTPDVSPYPRIRERIIKSLRG